MEEKEQATNQERKIKLSKIKFDNKYLPIGAGIIAFITLTLASYALYPKLKGIKINKEKKEEFNLPSPSKDILFFTQPAYQINGKVKSVSAQKLTIESELSYNPYNTAEMMMPITPPNNENANQAPTPPPTPIQKTISFDVEMDDKTIIERQGYYIPLLFPPQNYNPNRFGYAEIKNGDLITITSKEDLRTIKENKIKAIRIQLPPIQNQIEGKIKKIESNKIEIDTQGMAITPILPPSEKNQNNQQKTTFTFNIDENTEISYMPMINPSASTSPNQMPEPPKPIRLDINSIKEGERVRIYTKEDIFKSQSILKAERIEPLERR